MKTLVSLVPLEAALHSEKDLGFICSQLQFLTQRVSVVYKDKSDSGNALHAYCLLVGHWLFIDVEYFKMFVK